MEGDQPQEASAPPAAADARPRRPEKPLYAPKGQRPANGPRDKAPQPQGEAKPRPRPRYMDKARKNAKNKKDKAGGGRGGGGGGGGGDEAGDGKPEGRLEEGGAGPQGGDDAEEGCPGDGAGAEREAGSGEKGAEEEEEEEEEEESWDALFNDEGECLGPHVIEELSQKAGRKKVPVQEARFDYYGSRDGGDRGDGDHDDGDVDLREDELAHIVEIYDFPQGFKTEDLLKSFQDYQQRGFDVQWVDDTHALGLFSSPIAAREALSTKHPLMKIRPLSKSSVTTRAKARSCSDYLLPSKERPQTSAALARRLVIGALGVKSNQSHEQREAEKRKLAEARELKRLAARQRDDAWEGK